MDPAYPVTSSVKLAEQKKTLDASDQYLPHSLRVRVYINDPSNMAMSQSPEISVSSNIVAKREN